MSKQSVKTTINANIKTNGNQEITGSVLNSVLNEMVDNLAEEASTSLELSDLSTKMDKLIMGEDILEEKTDYVFPQNYGYWNPGGTFIPLTNQANRVATIDDVSFSDNVLLKSGIDETYSWVQLQDGSYKEISYYKTGTEQRTYDIRGVEWTDTFNVYKFPNDSKKIDLYWNTSRADPMTCIYVAIVGKTQGVTERIDDLEQNLESLNSWKEDAEDRLVDLSEKVDSLFPDISSDVKFWSPFPYIPNGKEINGYWQSGGSLRNYANYVPFIIDLANIDLSKPVFIKISSNFGTGEFSYVKLDDGTYVTLTSCFVETISSDTETEGDKHKLNKYVLPSNSVHVEVSIMTTYLSVENFKVGGNYNTLFIYNKTPLLPHVVYSVCNDGNKGRKRNLRQSLYVDHALDDVYDELDIKINNENEVSFYSSMNVTNSNEENPAITYNKGSNTIEEDVSLIIGGRNINKSTIAIKHRSSLNSVTSSSFPKVLCIGDSITYGELALSSEDDYTNNHAYHIVCKELFMKDNIDDGAGYEIAFLGQFAKSCPFSYNGTEYVANTHHEGRRGFGIEQYLSGYGSASAFFNQSTGKFSILSYIEKYRTMDDNGNRLMLNDPEIGTEINESNINSIDVCTPTHIVIALGMNGGATFDQYKEMIDIINQELPNVYVGIAIPDSAGTYFPSLHKGYGDKFATWNLRGDQGSRHNVNYSLMEMINVNFSSDEYEAKRVYVLPFYWVSPTAESVANRKFENGGYAPFGWCPAVHSNADGHKAWGYCLYSWIKYTIAHSL